MESLWEVLEVLRTGALRVTLRNYGSSKEWLVDYLHSYTTIRTTYNQPLSHLCANIPPLGSLIHSVEYVILDIFRGFGVKAQPSPGAILYSSVPPRFPRSRKVNQLRHIILMKNQRPNLNALPLHLPLIPPIHKRTMRRPPRPPVRLRIKTLYQQTLLRTLLMQIVPPMPLPGPNRHRLDHAIRINKLLRHKIAIWDGICVRDGEGVFPDGFDRTPDVNDLEAGFEEAGGEEGEVAVDAFGGVFVRQIDVDAADRGAEVKGAWAVGGAADGVVEGEDSGGAGGGFQDVCDLGVILLSDAIVVLELGFATGVLVDLEARLVQGVLVFFSTDVVHEHGSGRGRLIGSRWLADVASCWKASITRVFIIAEFCNDIVGAVSA